MHVDPQLHPQGALREADGSVLWRVWAPACEHVSLVTWPEGARAVAEMQPEGPGYFIHRRTGVPEGLRYAYLLGDGRERPDPASRWQPDGVHQPSALFFPEDYRWSSSGWRGVPREDLAIYELHVGTFTPEGTFEAVIPRLPMLRDLGVTAIEMMPVAQFPGTRNWGYDGVHPYAAQSSYGGPRALQRLIEAAHQTGLAVLLDVVYNHFGPEGNYLAEFGPYFTEAYRTPWGPAVNYDGPDCDPVRRFVIDNACMWVRDFRFDGLRLDAVHAIYDLGARHILEELQDAVQQVAAEQDRAVHVIAETHQNDIRLLNPSERGGYGLDGVWSDDFHHSLHALLTGERDGYYADFGAPEQVVKAFNDAFVYDGGYSPFRRRRVGSRVGGTDRSRFVVFLKNHDQIGNRAFGDRPPRYLSPAQQRLSAGLLLISPYVPLIFMGEEYGEERPFPFFCEFGDDWLVEAIREGRRREFEELQFEWGSDIPDPQSEETFASARLSWSWPEGSSRAGLRALYRDLLHARRTWPALRDRRHTTARLVDSRRQDGGNGRLLVIDRGARGALAACANLSAGPQPVPAPFNGRADLLLSTEAESYGGGRSSPAPVEELLPHEMLLFGSGEERRC